MALDSVMESFTRMGLPPIFHSTDSNVSHTNFSSFAGNSETNASNSPPSGAFPVDVMDTFLATAGQASPLMQIILFVYRLLGRQLGLDPSVILTMLGFLWGASKIWSQFYEYMQGFIDKYLMCGMYISEDDHIYDHLMKWLSQQPNIRKDRYLMAQTVWKSAWDDEDELEDALFWTSGGEGEDSDKKYLNFSNQAAQSNPRYIPAMGSTAFWHKGTYFWLYRRKESFMNTNYWGGAMKDVEEIKIACFGRSMEPIKQLLADAKALYYHDTYQKTTIYRPREKEQRREYNMWQQVARRPVRPMPTVVLDSKEKHDVLEDINEYLHPSTPRWYASRGIPLRRGYLFYGPPGTGKTSFSFAIAGVFGIDIYVISLQDSNVTEEDLASLFTHLPRRCIVLLEDIDSAGLKRDLSSDSEKANESKDEKEGKDKKKKKKQDDEDSESDSDSGSDSEDEKKKKKKRKSSKKDKKDKKKDKTSSDGISLSGLLNAIDGVASHEGRILIMTTNKPESLDDALIRPGRVDVQVGFSNATKTQAGELFHRMYEATQPKQLTAMEEKLSEVYNNETSDVLENISAEEMKAISEEFGQKIPEGTFSPAEIQGFLLKRKKFPRKALEEVAGWVEASLKQKETNSKLSTVQ